MKRSARRAWPAWTRTIPLLVVAAPLSGVVPVVLGDSSFDPVRLLRPFARLCFCVTGGAAVAAWLCVTGDTARRIVENAFALSAIVGLALYAAILAGAPLPDSIVRGHDRPDCPACDSERRACWGSRPSSSSA